MWLVRVWMSCGASMWVVRILCGCLVVRVPHVFQVTAEPHLLPRSPPFQPLWAAKLQDPPGPVSYSPQYLRQCPSTAPNIADGEHRQASQRSATKTDPSVLKRIDPFNYLALNMTQKPSEALSAENTDDSLSRPRPHTRPCGDIATWPITCLLSSLNCSSMGDQLTVFIPASEKVRNVGELPANNYHTTVLHLFDDSKHQAKQLKAVMDHECEVWARQRDLGKGWKGVDIFCSSAAKGRYSDHSTKWEALVPSVSR